MKKNRVRELIKQGKSTLGAWIGTNSSDIVEILAHLDFDWFVFDTEHGPLNAEMVQTLMQAMNGSDVVPMMRVAWNDPVLIKKALDIGAYGLVIPWVNSKEQAIAAVQACRYPPLGIRGSGPRRAAQYGFDPDYRVMADEEIMVIPQIEHIDAVNHIDEIFAVEGIDAYLIGPSDLSFSMGKRGQWNDPEVQQAIDRVFEAGKRAGVAGGIYAFSYDMAKACLARGFQFISIGSDTSFLIRGAREALSTIRPK